MRGATQTRKRRVGWSVERIRFAYRYVMGQEIALGNKHQGYYTNGQHAALRLSPFIWLALLIFLAVEHVHVWIISLVYTQLVFTALFLPTLFLWWATRRVKAWWQFRGMDDAFADTVGEVIGWPDYVKPYLWLHFPMNWRTKPAEIRIDLKWDSGISELKRKAILEAVSAGLGRPIDPRYVTWNIEVKPSPWPWNFVWPSLVIRPEFPPPDVAMFADYVKRIEKYKKDSQIALGIGLHDATEVIDIDHDAPHGVIGADSGRGKSSMEALIGCQMCKKGAVAVILDPKIVSLQAFKGLPNVAYFAGEEAAHHGLLAIKAELKRRAEAIDVPWGVPRPDIGPRIMVLIEEADSLVDELRNWMQDAGEGRSNVRSISAMNRLRNMGRELKINIWTITQTGLAAALGGAGGQTGFGFRIISANHEGVWKKLAPNVKDIPSQSEHIGRWHLNKPGSGAFPIEFQAFGFPKPAEGEEHLKFADARAYAGSGKVGVIPELIQEALDRKDTPAAGVSQGPIPVGDIPVAPTSGTHVGDTPVPVPHLRLVGDAAGDRRAEWAGRIEAQIADLYAEPVAEDRWLTLGEARKAGILDPGKTMNATRIAASKSPLLEAHRRYREKPPYAGAREWPEDVLVRYARGTVNA